MRQTTPERCRVRRKTTNRRALRRTCRVRRKTIAAAGVTERFTAVEQSAAGARHTGTCRGPVTTTSSRLRKREMFRVRPRCNARLRRSSKRDMDTTRLASLRRSLTRPRVLQASARQRSLIKLPPSALPAADTNRAGLVKRPQKSPPESNWLGRGNLHWDAPFKR